MLMPSIFGENLFDDFDRWMDTSFHDVDKALYGKHAKNMMKTDVKETDSGNEVDVDLPGFKKDEIQLLHSFPTRRSSDLGMSRSFYVGEVITEKDIHAKYEYGILKLSIPKEQPKAVPEKHLISIEG